MGPDDLVDIDEMTQNIARIGDVMHRATEYMTIPSGSADGAVIWDEGRMLSIDPSELLSCVNRMTDEQKCELLKMLLDAVPNPEADLPRQKINNLQRIFARRQKATS